MLTPILAWLSTADQISLVTDDRTRGVVLCAVWTAAHADPHAARRPVDQREEGVVDAEADGEVEVVDVDGPRRDHDVHQAGHRVQAVQEHVQNVHPGACIASP